MSVLPMVNLLTIQYPGSLSLLQFHTATGGFNWIEFLRFYLVWWERMVNSEPDERKANAFRIQRGAACM